MCVINVKQLSRYHIWMQINHAATTLEEWRPLSLQGGCQRLLKGMSEWRGGKKVSKTESFKAEMECTTLACKMFWSFWKHKLMNYTAINPERGVLLPEPLDLGGYLEKQNFIYRWHVQILPRNSLVWCWQDSVSKLSLVLMNLNKWLGLMIIAFHRLTAQVWLFNEESCSVLGQNNDMFVWKDKHISFTQWCFCLVQIFTLSTPTRSTFQVLSPSTQLIKSVLREAYWGVGGGEGHTPLHSPLVKSKTVRQKCWSKKLLMGGNYSSAWAP